MAQKYMLIKHIRGAPDFMKHGVQWEHTRAGQQG